MMTAEDNVHELKQDSIKIVTKICKMHPNFSVNNVISILPELINHVETFKNLEGLDKRDYVISMIKYVIENTDGPGDDDIWDPILISLIPSTVDLLIDVSKGSIKLNKKHKVLSKLNCFKKK